MKYTYLTWGLEPNTFGEPNKVIRNTYESQSEARDNVNGKNILGWGYGHIYNDGRVLAERYYLSQPMLGY